MKNSKLFAGLGTALILGATLTGCGSQGLKSTGVQQEFYTTDPTTFDFGKATGEEDFALGANFIEQLVETNEYGEFVPAVAKEIPTLDNGGISEDGLTWTFNLRKDVKWVTSEGEEYAKVKAQDFVYALKRAADNQVPFSSFPADVIAGYQDYLDGKETDFSKVGVVAKDDNTLVFTLIKPTPYFVSLLTTGPFYPINEKFATEKGKEFGKTKAEDILYSGPFVLANYTSKSAIELKANDQYWDTKNVHLTGVKFTFSQESNPAGDYEAFKKGAVSSVALQPQEAYFKDVKKNNGDNIYVSQPNLFTLFGSFNLNRQAYEITTDKHDNASTKAAIANKDFRLAIVRSINRTAYLQSAYGKEYGGDRIRNQLTPSDFVTVDGGTYSDAVQKNIVEQGGESWTGVKFADGVDDFYNVDVAKSELAKAKETLGDSVKWPIHIDIPVSEKYANQINKFKSYKQSVESALGKDNVVFDINIVNDDKAMGATYFAETGAASDFDLSFPGAWGADFQDPSTYLNIANPENGDILKNFGLDKNPGKDDATDPEYAAKKAAGLYDYKDLLDAAAAITATDKTNERYAAYAKAEAFLIGDGIIIPTNNAGSVPALTYRVPFTGAYASSGTSGDRYKYMKLQKTPVLGKDYDKAQKEWTAKRNAASK
ncbi:MAG: peptide ABC transporter substrate-binding protein [Lactobacillales bacterium]|jgi:ABC-type oligopeptide transport system substrate-binding subunit|nr:peptide ABC transporter substrate-binding protein [Lactobacillales bacterium]